MFTLFFKSLNNYHLIYCEYKTRPSFHITDSRFVSILSAICKQSVDTFTTETLMCLTVMSIDWFPGASAHRWRQGANLPHFIFDFQYHKTYKMVYINDFMHLNYGHMSTTQFIQFLAVLEVVPYEFREKLKPIF